MSHETSQTALPHQLTLVKNDQRWVMRYMPGEEQAVLRWLADTASNENTEIDWFDAAVLCNQMGDEISQQLKELMPEV